MDKVHNVTDFGPNAVDFAAGLPELGLELDDQRGRQDEQVTTRLFPTSAGGGGQAAAIYIVNRYRPGNRYRAVRLNGIVVQYNSVKFDVTFASEFQRAGNVINTAGVAAVLGNVVDGVAEFGNGGPLTTDPALTSHAQGVVGFITTRGLAICNLNTAVVADDLLGPDVGVAGRLSTLAVTTPTAAETIRIANAAAGKGVRALTAEPATGFKANLGLVAIT